MDNDENRRQYEHSNGNMRKVIKNMKTKEKGLCHEYKSDFIRAFFPKNYDPNCRGHAYEIEEEDPNHLHPEDLVSV